MGRLSLVIADTDTIYVDSLVNFITSGTYRFQVSSFTKRDYLTDYLEKSDFMTNILLISPEMYSESIPFRKAELTVILSEDNMLRNREGFNAVNKYQHVDMLIGKILSLYSGKHQGGSMYATGNRKTRLAAVYSSSGGAGKTSIATACAVQCAYEGMNVFYLNLEDIHSTGIYFKSYCGNNLSNVLYHLKDKNKTSPIPEIETSKCIDSEYHIHYFMPPDYFREMDEVLADDLVLLVNELRNSSRYDIVFIDMSSRIDSRNIALMDSSDDIIFVVAADEISIFKSEAALAELERIPMKSGLAIAERFFIVLNKYRENCTFKGSRHSFCGKSFAVRLPFCEDMLNSVNIRCFLDIADGFGKGIGILLKQIINRQDGGKNES